MRRRKFKASKGLSPSAPFQRPEPNWLAPPGVRTLGEESNAGIRPNPRGRPWVLFFRHFIQKLAGPLRSRWPEFPLYHSPNNLSIGKPHKHHTQQNPIIVQHYLLISHAICVILITSRGESEWQGKVTTDLPNAVENASARKTLRRSALKKNVKNTLTNPLKYDTIRVQKVRARQPQKASSPLEHSKSSAR